jgi:hypothetical protein
MRQYEKTHQHLSFTPDLGRGGAKLWISLGECQSKCEHIARVPMRPDAAGRLNMLCMAKGVLATTAMEGNTLSEEETLKLLTGELSLPPSRQYLATEIDNVVSACKRLQLAQINQPDSLKLTSDLAKALNREVLSGLELGADVKPGVVRRYSVVVDHHLGAPSEDCQYLLDRLCDWLSGEEFSAPSPDLKSSTPWSRPSSLTSTSPGYALSATATGARRDCWSLPSWSTRECRPPRPTC